MEDVPAFRASKRRKTAPKAIKARSGEASEDESSSSLIKPRSQPKTRAKGVQYSNTTAVSRNVDEESATGLAPIDDAGTIQTPGGLQSRFVGSGGGSQTMNVDKHMYVCYGRCQTAKS